MIAACDTFRSGAVEQLKTHCARLGVPLYERGYEKDPAKVAFEAQRAAERSHKDVLLVDTAGARRPLPPHINCLLKAYQLLCSDDLLFGSLMIFKFKSKGRCTVHIHNAYIWGSGFSLNLKPEM